MALPYGFGKKEMDVALILLDFHNLISRSPPPPPPNSSSSSFFQIPSSWPTTIKRRRRRRNRTNTTILSSTTSSQPAVSPPPPTPSSTITTTTRVYFRRTKGNLLRCEKKRMDDDQIQQISPSTNSNCFKPPASQEESHVMILSSTENYRSSDGDQEVTPIIMDPTAAAVVSGNHSQIPESELDYSRSRCKRAKNLESSSSKSKQLISSAPLFPAISPLLIY